MSADKQSNGHSREDSEKLIEKCINTVRLLSVDMIEKAKSGHPGAPMGCAPMGHILFNDFMDYCPTKPDWVNRDRFVLSNGHACAMLYSFFHLTGYSMSMDDLKKFRQLGSITPGHPENFITPGVEVSTGPLGQGITNAVGLAIAEKHLASVFNKDGMEIIDHYTYVICGDGCLQEGISSEASSLAGHLKLGKLIVLYDDNHITIDGDTALTFTENVKMRYESYNWHVQVVEDGTDLNALRRAVENAKAETNKPSMIKVRTVIGHGSSREGSEATHGAPLGSADVANVKTKFGFNPAESFVVAPEVSEFYMKAGLRGTKKMEAWEKLFDSYSNKYPELANELTRRMLGKLPTDWEKFLPDMTSQAKPVATRVLSGQVLNSLAEIMPELMGGSADLSGSNNVTLKCSGDFQASSPDGRYIRFGVREHAMAAICNGMWAHGGIRPYCASFLSFLGYAQGALRISALSHFGVLYIMTHDSIGLGEDGPTHQPVEMLQMLRATPNLSVFRPADGNETVGCYKCILSSQEGRSAKPSVLSLSRQNTPPIVGSDSNKVQFGAYVISDLKTGDKADSLPYPTLTLIGTGTELVFAQQTAESLVEKYRAKNESCWMRVVSMPCWELFDLQPIEYRLSVFMVGSPVMSIEASESNGWLKYSHAPFGLRPGYFGLSAPANHLFEHFGFTPSNLLEKGLEVIEFYSKKREFMNGNSGDYPYAASKIDFPLFQEMKPVGI